MKKRVAILQSNYIPWKGYFDIIHDTDEFIFHDDIQYTKQDWRNRNRIKTAGGPIWLTIPVGQSEKRRICDVELPEGWAEAHWRQIEATYRSAPCFEVYRSFFQDLYCRARWRYLADFNQHFIRAVSHDLLDLTTRFRDSREFRLLTSKQERVLDILRRVGADTYVSGPAGKNYLDPGRFAQEGIELVWKCYEGYPEYAQHHPPFCHNVTILDLLFHTGRDAPRFIWG